jgi:predicted ABC-type sugar transport system permease subunit
MGRPFLLRCSLATGESAAFDLGLVPIEATSDRQILVTLSAIVLGLVIGTLITGILTNMLRLNNVDSNTELMLKAVIIVAAVWMARRS